MQAVPPPGLNRLAHHILDQKILPGLEVLIARHEEVLGHWCWGMQSYSPQAKVLICGQTVFDLASLTKPLATTLCALLLQQRQLLCLQQPLGDFFAEFKQAEKSRITLIDLLTHRAGFAAWVDLYSHNQTSQQALQTLVQQPLEHPPRSTMLYSDVGFLLLAACLRQVTGHTLKTLFANTVAQPLGLKHCAFRPLEEGWENPFAPTQNCPWRKRVLCGEVHDENAWILNQEGGNAGLFAHAGDVHRLATAVLRGLQGLHSPPWEISQHTLTFMCQNHNPPSLEPRGLGWDMKASRGYSSAGQHFSQRAIGHTAFTGPSLWMEPQSGILVVILCSRVNGGRFHAQKEWIALRPMLHDALLEAFTSL